jgi:protease-4
MLSRSTQRALVALGAALGIAGAAHAQLVPPRASDGVALPFRGVAQTDDASAILHNPANLPFGGAPEARFSWVHTSEDAAVPVRGYSVGFALPFWILGTGLELDWMRAPNAAPPPFSLDGDGRSYGWVRWALGVRMGELASIGNTLAWSHADTSRLDGFFSASTALTVRPSRFFSAAVVLRDWNTPENDAGLRIQPSVDTGLALRPFGGRRLLEIGVEGSYRTGSDRWVPRTQLAVLLPYVGRFRAGAELLDLDTPQLLASAGVDLNLDALQVQGGALFGNALTADGTGFYIGAAIRGVREEPGLPAPARVVKIRIDTTPGVRRHVRLLRRLWRLADDRECDGVLFVLRDEPAESLAATEELADAVRLLRARGKKVLCHLEDAGGRELYLCSGADRVAVNPAGGIRFAGLAMRHFYLGGLLEKIGVRADFVRIGAHKSAPEQFDLGSSEVAREDHRALLEAIERMYLGQIGRGRGMSVEEARRRIAAGPYIASEARAARFVDNLVYEDEIERFVEESFGGGVRLVDLAPERLAPEYWRTPPRVAVVYLHGDMVDGESRTIPIIGIRLAGARTIGRALKQAREDPSVRAVVFRIETGGGSSLAADLILREAVLTAKAKPLLVSMGGKAASGGYYAAVAANQIFASRASITGSIGIFYGKVDVSGLLDKVGVRAESLRTAPRADAESFFRPFTDEERKTLGVKVKQFYDLFVGRVAEGRKMTPAAVHAVGEGRVWTGGQARERGLVDVVGGLRQALERARALGDLPADAPIVELPEWDPSLLERVLELAGVPVGDRAQDGEDGGEPAASEAPAWLPPPMLDLARALLPLLVYEPHQPLARMESVVLDP